MTPEYVLLEMDMDQVSDCLEYLAKTANHKPLGPWVIVGAKQDLGWIEQNRLGKVIKPDGRNDDR